ncbi:MAG: hypothetical protein V2A66_05980 [Pseudomonadota bacterium]
MKGKLERTTEDAKPESGQPHSSIDLWRLMGGRAQPVRAKGHMAVDGMLAVYGDRVTYTFILDEEVASIHFDRIRREIFFKGHNIHNFQLTERQMAALQQMTDILAADPNAKAFISDYSATLARLIADNNKGASARAAAPKAK